VDNDIAKAFATSQYYLPLQICLGSRAACVRRAAASACVSLLDDIEMVPDMVEDSFTNRLLCSFNDSQFSQNQLHGELLRLVAILKGTRSLMPFETLLKTVHVVSRHISSCSWIAKDRRRNSCHVTRCAMLKVFCQSSKIALIVLSTIASKKNSTRGTEVISQILRILDLGEEASSICLNETSVCVGEGASALGLSAMAVTAAKLRALVLHARARVATYSYTKDCFAEFVSLLSHPVFEVRETTVKSSGEVMNMPIDRKADNAGAAASIWSPLINVLRNETYHPILSGVLIVLPKVLAGFSEYALKLVWSESGGIVWSRVVELSVASPSIQLREAALVLLGHCVKIKSQFPSMQCLTGSIDSNVITGVAINDIEQWMNFLEFVRTDRQLSTTRVAALQSIEASRILQRTEAYFSSFRARCLIILVDLLQDDHERVRLAARQLARQLPVMNDAQPSLDVLPALIATHEVMSSSETTILSYLEEILGMTMLEGGMPGLLHILFSCGVSYIPQKWNSGLISTADVYLTSSQVIDRDLPPSDARALDWDCDLDDPGNDGNGPGSKLFTDDSDQPCTEPALTLQLAIWAVYCMHARGRRERLRDVEKEDLLQRLVARWTDDLIDALLRHTAQSSSSPGPPGAEQSVLVFDASFEDSNPSTFYFVMLKKLARLAAASLMLPDEGALATNVCGLRQALEVVSIQSKIHPSLFSSAQGVASLLMSPTDGEALHAVLFLLPRLPYR
jgi:hypothetical protein